MSRSHGTPLKLGLACFTCYLAVYGLRKPWLCAQYPNKAGLVVAQIVGYAGGKVGGLAVVASLPRANIRNALLCAALVALLGWMAFAVASTFATQALALAVGCAPLAVCWSFIFRFIEGREGSDMVASTLAIAFVIGSGVAKALGAVLLRAGLTSATMPLAAALLCLAPYVATVCWLSALQPPSGSEVEALGGARVALGAREQLRLARQHWPGFAAVGLYFFCFSALRDLRDAFQAQSAYE